MINTKTSNKSFLNMWHTLQDFDIENNSFMLELKDESLLDFKISDLETDDKSIKSSLLQKVKTECKNNIWFFFRECVRLCNPVVFNSKQIDYYKNEYVLTPIEMRMIYAFDNNLNFLVDKSIDNYGVRTTLLLLKFYQLLFKFDTNFITIDTINENNIESDINNIFYSNIYLMSNIEDVKTIQSNYLVANDNDESHKKIINRCELQVISNNCKVFINANENSSLDYGLMDLYNLIHNNQCNIYGYIKNIEKFICTNQNDAVCIDLIAKLLIDYYDSSSKEGSYKLFDNTNKIEKDKILLLQHY